MDFTVLYLWDVRVFYTCLSHRRSIIASTKGNVKSTAKNGMPREKTFSGMPRETKAVLDFLRISRKYDFI